MKFRKAKKGDLAQMMKILKENNLSYQKSLALKELKEMFSESLIKPTFIVAEKEKTILGFGGFISSWVDNTVFDIFWINVALEQQKKKIGSQLIKELITRIKKLRNPKATMILISTKKPLFYQRLGFKKITKKYDKDYILMGLKI